MKMDQVPHGSFSFGRNCTGRSLHFKNEVECRCHGRYLSQVALVGSTAWAVGVHFGGGGVRCIGNSRAKEERLGWECYHAILEHGVTKDSAVGILCGDVGDLPNSINDRLLKCGLGIPRVSLNIKLGFTHDKTRAHGA
jgi:hypothetical protein